MNLRIPLRIEAVNIDRSVLREVIWSTEITETGATFVLKNDFEPGRMLHISGPIPQELRRFDQNADEYRVYAIVEDCKPTEINGVAAHCIRVAFAGREPPESYRRDPLQLYLLDLNAAPGERLFREDPKPANTRRHRRYTIPIDADLAVCDEKGSVVAHERTVTENISLGGAAVFSSLPLRTGDLVRLTSDQYNVTLTAEVRHLRTGADGLPRIHLKFVNGEFPLPGIDNG